MARQKPSVYYGLHMAPGVAEYREPGKAPYRVLVGEDTIKKMNSTFPGCPVYVRHVPEVDLENIQEEADGYVVESFYNKADGKHWAKFVVVSDEGRQAIQKGWTLSNSYFVKNQGQGGLWHGVEYQNEIFDGEYDHLAIVPDPRYEESMILTPEQFKAYNEAKEAELIKLANAKDKPEGDSEMGLSFFKKAKVENSTDLENTIVTLPKCKKDRSILQLVNEADERLSNGYMCNGEERVKVGDKEMSVNDLLDMHKKLNAEHDVMKKKNEDDADADAHEEEGEGYGELPVANSDDEEKEKEKKKEKKENSKTAEELKAEADEKQVKADNVKKLKNAREKAQAASEEEILILNDDKVALGQSRYGSTKK